MPHPADLLAGQKLKYRRLELGYSQTKIADFVGVTFQQIQKYERGANRMSAGTLFDLSLALAVPVSYFFAEIIERIERRVKPRRIKAERRDKTTTKI